MAASRPPAIFDLGPQEMVAAATAVANVLRDLIVKQRLFVTIQGRDYVKVDGWVTMGNLIGVLPREREVRELADGSYEAHVDLYSIKTGTLLGGASALCSIDEKRWKTADKYARRSMAITRATGKAYRLAFSWIMTMAGYEPTPEEEMPRPEAPATSKGFDPHSESQVTALRLALAKEGVPENLWEPIARDMVGRSFNELQGVIERAAHA